MDKSSTPTAAPALVIDGSPDTFGSYCRELWAYRAVAGVMVRRDLIVRFRQTFIGLAWLLFRPLMLTAALTFAFGFLAGFENSAGTPYPLIILCGVIPWYFFSNAVPDAMNSLLGHMHIIQKVYFPRAIITGAAVAVDALEFLVAWLLFAATCLWYGYLPGWQIVLFPLFFLQLVLLSAGIGLWLAMANVKFRDIGNLVPFLLTIGFFLSPIGYVASRIPEKWQLLFALNPLVGIVEGMRWSLLRGSEGFPSTSVMLSLAFTAAISIIGVRYFLANETTLVDLA